MNRARFAVAALLGIALVSAARGQDTRTFTLKFKDEHGRFVPFYQELTTEVRQHIKVQGQDLPQRQTSVYWYAWTPLKEETTADGVRWTLKQKIEGLKMDIDISGNPIKYDSRTPDADASTLNPGLNEFYKNLIGSEFTVTLGKGYRVEKVEGKDAFLNKLGAGSALMDALLKKVMTDDALKEMADPTFKLLPDAPKKKGDKWERKTVLNLGPVGTYELTYKFTYAEPDRAGLEKFTVETAVTYSPPKEPADGLLFRIKEGSKLTSDPAGSKGVVYYDPHKMWIEEATLNIKLKGDLIVTIGGTDTKVELTQEQKTVVKTRATSFLAPETATPPATPTTAPPPTVTLPHGTCDVLIGDRPRRIALFHRFPCRPCFPVRCR